MIGYFELWFLKTLSVIGNLTWLKSRLTSQWTVLILVKCFTFKTNCWVFCARKFENTQKILISQKQCYILNCKPCFINHFLVKKKRSNYQYFLLFQCPWLCCYLFWPFFIFCHCLCYCTFVELPDFNYWMQCLEILRLYIIFL